MSAKATEQLNIRVHPDTKATFRERARREGMSQAQLLEAFLRMPGTLPRVDLEAPQPPADNGAAAAVADRKLSQRWISLATWLSGRLGMPRALCAAAIADGRVTVGGSAYSEELIDPALLELGVTHNGIEVA